MEPDVPISKRLTLVTPTSSDIFSNVPGIAFTAESRTRIPTKLPAVRNPLAKSGRSVEIAPETMLHTPYQKDSVSYGINASPDSGTGGASSYIADTGAARNNMAASAINTFLIIVPKCLE
jgi:hypothetical protein